MINKENIVSDFAEYNPQMLVPKIHASRYDDRRGNRFYFFEENGGYRSAIGITTLLGKVMPENYFLTQWKLDWGDSWKELLDLTAEFGTYMHIGCAYILQNRAMPDEEYFTEGRKIVKKIMKFESKTPANMLEKNMISFWKFVNDYNIKPLLIEALLVYQTQEGEAYCLTQDVLCEASYTKKWKEDVCVGEISRGENKGKPKYEKQERTEEVKEIWCLDFKSNFQFKSEKDFFESHKLQLIGTKKAVEQNFGIVADKLANWSPLGWKTKEKQGAYALKFWDVTDKDEAILRLYEKLAYLQGMFRPSGSVEELDVFANDFDSMYKNYSYIDYVSLLNEVEENG